MDGLSRRALLGVGALVPLLSKSGGQAMTSPMHPSQVRGLGNRIARGVQDSTMTGLINPYLPGTGWVVIFTPDDLPMETEFEVYQIALDGPIGSSAVVMLDGNEHSYVQTAWANTASDDPPMLVRFGQSIQFCWNFPFTSGPYNRTTNIQPRVTIWLRKTAQGVYY